MRLHISITAKLTVRTIFLVLERDATLRYAISMQEWYWPFQERFPINSLNKHCRHWLSVVLINKFTNRRRRGLPNVDRNWKRNFTMTSWRINYHVKDICKSVYINGILVLLFLSIWWFSSRFRHYLEHTLDYIQRVLTDRSTYCSHGLNDPKFQVVSTGHGLVYCAPIEAPRLTLERRQNSQYYLKEYTVTGLEDGMMLGMLHQLLHGHSPTIPPDRLNGGLNDTRRYRADYSIYSKRVSTH